MSITIAAIECGGTSFRIAICTIQQQQQSHPLCNNNNNSNNNNNNIQFIHREQILTNIGIIQLRHEIQRILQLYKNIIQAVGIASFGPIQLQHTTSTSTTTSTTSEKNQNNENDEYGMILSTSPKIEFHHFNIVTIVQDALSCYHNHYNNNHHNHYNNIPILVDTDVNAPAMAEYIQYNKNNKLNNKNNKMISSLAYITVGTGVGVGLIINHQPVHGILHPELGHIPIVPSYHFYTNNDNNDDDMNNNNNNKKKNEFIGYSWGRRHHSNIPFHGKYTVEGMTSSVALTERYYHSLLHVVSNNTENDTTTTGTTTTTTNTENDTTTTITTNHNNEYDRNILATIDDQHEIWDHLAYHIASLCTNLFLFSIERIVLGGGVIMGRIQHTSLLLHKIHTIVHEQLNGYILPLQSLEAIQSRIVVSEYFGNDSGLYGAIYLAQKAYNDHHHHHHQSIIEQKQESSTTTDTSNSQGGMDDKEVSTRNDQQKIIKQIAFHHGLWHGILIGMIGTGLLYKYYFTSQGRRTVR